VDWLDTAKAVASVGGWVVGALTLDFNLYKFRREHASGVRVTLTQGWLVAGHDLSDAKLIVDAANTGSNALTLSWVGISLPRDQKLFDPFGSGGGSALLPHRLSPGENDLQWMDSVALASSLYEHGLRGKVKLRGVCTDQTGSTSRSKPLTIHVESWLST
jgi:hypothetical protein